MAHDADPDNEDNVDLYLDSFHDRENAFFFRTNPLGVRVDGYLRDNGNDVPHLD